MLELKSATRDYSIHVPTNVKEITPEILKGLTKGLIISPYYCVIALAFEAKLSTIAVKLDKNSNATVSVVPIIAYISDEDAKSSGFSIGDKIIIDRSALERGSHLPIATAIASANVFDYVTSDPILRDNLIRGGNGTISSILQVDTPVSKKEKDAVMQSKSPVIYTLNFKIVGLSDIKTAIPMENKVVDPFKTPVKEVSEGALKLSK